MPAKIPSKSAPKPASAGNRFVISHRRAGHKDTDTRKASRAGFDRAFAKSLSRSVQILGDSVDFKNLPDDSRRVIYLEADRAELLRKRSELGSDVLIEPELSRGPLRHRPGGLPNDGSGNASDRVPSPIGTGARFELTVLNQGKAAVGVPVVLILASRFGGLSSHEATQTGDDGTASFDYDPHPWIPTTLVVEPDAHFWPLELPSPKSGLSIELTALPKSGPMSWWQAMTGHSEYLTTRGQGIRVGLVDTGVGPHPYLSHVQSLGAFVGGRFLSEPTSGHDSENHGTHVAGILGAKPTTGSGDFGGIAAGIEILSTRVFDANATTHQGDIANAIEALCAPNPVDLINLSLGGAYSEIERDAVRAARERGTLCICAAGNDWGGPVLFPAAYPESVAISAAGLYGVDFPGTTAFANLPTSADQLSPSGIYVARFSSAGPQIRFLAPGNGIISTVPALPDATAPYMAMDGTSMASPVATATLAALLASDTQYRSLPRTADRAAYALAAGLARAWPQLLNPVYQGAGLIRG